MFQIQNLTSDSKQKQSLVLPDGNKIEISIRFVPMQLGWFISSLSYKDFTVTNLRITNLPNILYPFKNLIPFGLACLSVSNREPQLQEDFLTEASRLFILTEDEVDAYARFLSGQV